MEVHGGADIRLQHMEDSTQEQVLGSHGDPMLTQPVPEGLYPVEVPMLKQFVKNCSFVERNHIGEVCGGLSPMGEIPH
ncbi:hypothetical protein WISP_94969 [Willisornis vidua]|uniref:Uncharacterized protein n=1 Tax=Willisornis vidua TaxID=1566151 RepID=A0ABQ9D049_9PASS|nr:hypothetical protein WISP_94969 [Willisornis vidua]